MRSEDFQRGEVGSLSLRFFLFSFFTREVSACFLGDNWALWLFLFFRFSILPLHHHNDDLCLQGQI